jgi:hypothetical protein
MVIASSHRVSLAAYLISPPQLGGMPWNPFSSTRIISLSYRQEAVSEHRGPRNRSAVGKLVRDRFGPAPISGRNLTTPTRGLERTYSQNPISTQPQCLLYTR